MHECMRVCLRVPLCQVDEPVQEEDPPVIDAVHDLHVLEGRAGAEQDGAIAVFNQSVV